MNRTRFLVQAAIIGAIYAVLTMAFGEFSYGPIQVRFAEALTVLPYFTPAAIPGLFVGCMIANIIGYGIYDVIFGSLATLIAALITRKIKNRVFVPLPPIIINGVVIGLMLHYLLDVPISLLALMGWVALGEFIACYAIGYPLLKLLEKYKDRIF